MDRSVTKPEDIQRWERLQQAGDKGIKKPKRWRTVSAAPAPGSHKNSLNKAGVRVSCPRPRPERLAPRPPRASAGPRCPARATSSRSAYLRPLLPKPRHARSATPGARAGPRPRRPRSSEKPRARVAMPRRLPPGVLRSALRYARGPQQGSGAQGGAEPGGGRGAAGGRGVAGDLAPDCRVVTSEAWGRPLRFLQAARPLCPKAQLWSLVSYPWLRGGPLGAVKLFQVFAFHSLCDLGTH